MNKNFNILLYIRIIFIISHYLDLFATWLEICIKYIDAYNRCIVYNDVMIIFVTN